MHYAAAAPKWWAWCEGVAKAWRLGNADRRALKQIHHNWGKHAVVVMVAVVVVVAVLAVSVVMVVVVHCPLNERTDGSQRHGLCTFFRSARHDSTTSETLEGAYVRARKAASGTRPLLTATCTAGGRAKGKGKGGRGRCTGRGGGGKEGGVTLHENTVD